MAVTYSQNKYFMTNAVQIMTQYLDHPVEEHYHDFVEIIYMFQGKCKHTIDEVEYPVSHGDMLIVNYDQVHSISGRSTAGFFNILIKPEFVDANLSQPENAFSLLQLDQFEDFQKIVNERKCVISFAGQERAALETLIFSLQRELEAKSPGWQLSVRSQMNLLLIKIFRKMAIPMDTGDAGINKELLNYIRSHCQEKLTLKKLSEYTHYNSDYFIRLFKQYTNMTPTEYIRVIRMEKACEILEGTDMKISDIYLEVGYSDKTKFFSDFRKAWGMSPLEYRKSRK